MKNRFNLFDDAGEQGFGLMSIVIAMGMSGIMIMTFTKMQLNNIRTMKHAEIKSILLHAKLKVATKIDCGLTVRKLQEMIDPTNGSRTMKSRCQNPSGRLPKKISLWGYTNQIVGGTEVKKEIEILGHRGEFDIGSPNTYLSAKCDDGISQDTGKPGISVRLAYFTPKAAASAKSKPLLENGHLNISGDIKRHIKDPLTGKELNYQNQLIHLFGGAKEKLCSAEIAAMFKAQNYATTDTTNYGSFGGQFQRRCDKITCRSKNDKTGACSCPRGPNGSVLYEARGVSELCLGESSIQPTDTNGDNVMDSWYGWYADADTVPFDRTKKDLGRKDAAGKFGYISYICIKKDSIYSSN